MSLHKPIPIVFATDLVGVTRLDVTCVWGSELIRNEEYVILEDALEYVVQAWFNWEEKRVHVPTRLA